MNVLRQTGKKNLGKVILLSVLLIGSLAVTELPLVEGALPHLPVASAATSDSTSTGIIETVYGSTPNSSGSWAAVVSAHESYPSVPYEVIINPSSGPGQMNSSAFASAIKTFAMHGITVLGYVPTGWCNDSMTTVEQQINDYAAWYKSSGLAGIFFDQMEAPNEPCNSGVSPINYYNTLTSYAVNTEGLQFTTGNPGTDVNSSYINTVRTINIFENASLPSSNSTLAGKEYSSQCQTQGTSGWHLCFDKSNFSFISYDISSLPPTAEIQGWSNYVGFMFITGANYFIVPSYIDQEVAALNTPSVGITVATDNSSLYTISGAGIVFYQPTASCAKYTDTCGEVLQSASPITLNASSGWQYELSAPSSFGSCTFSKWLDSGSTNPNRTITAPSSSTTYTAIYTGGSCGSSSSPSVTVDSENQTYGALPGYYTTLSYNGKVIQDGFTPVTFSNLVSGQNYTIDPEDYTCTFNHWNDTGSTVRLRTVTATIGNQKFTAVYTCPSASSVTVQSVDQNDNKITGYYTVLYNSTGSIINTGYTPVTFPDLTYGAKYVVRPEDYGSRSFAYWKDTGNTTRYRSFVANGVDQTFTAVYNCYSSPSVTVQTVNQNGAKITGYYVGLYNSGGTLINHGFSWVTFSSLSVGTTYSVEPDNYGSCAFNHWQDTGSTVRDRSFVAASSQTFTAVYTCT